MWPWLDEKSLSIMSKVLNFLLGSSAKLLELPLIYWTWKEPYIENVFPGKQGGVFFFPKENNICPLNLYHLGCNVPFNLVNVSYWFIIGVVISHFYPKMIKIHIKFWRKKKKKAKKLKFRRKKNPTFCLI
jgi:hypothetical protein